MLVIVPDDKDRFEEYNPSINASAYNTQTDVPGEHPQSLGPVDAVVIPTPSVGGVFGSGTRQGFSSGLRSWRRQFSGIVAALPPITNRVVGNVGANNRKNRLREGAKAQLTMYQQDNAAYLASYVGTISPDIVVGPQ